MAATSAAPVSTQISNPTLDNFFGLNIGNEYENGPSSSGLVYTRWTNPHLNQNSVIAPYIPGESLQFDVTFPSDFWNYDVGVVILSKVDLKTLVNCSTVCKFFYSASRSNLIWSNQLWNFLPDVKNVASDLCIFTPEQQYKVIFKRIQNECKPYIAKFNRNQELGNNCLKALKTLELQFQEAGGEEAAARFLDFVGQKIREGNYETSEQNFPDYLAGQMKSEITYLRDPLLALFGPNYDGTIESIDPMSEQGKIMNAIKVLVPNAFNDQEKFESVIEKSVAAQNTSSSNSGGPTIEDVTDVAESSEKNG